MAPTNDALPLQSVARDAGDSDSTTNPTSPIFIAGYTVIGLLVLGAALWLTLRWYRKRSQKERDDNREGAFLSVRGIVTEGEQQMAEFEPAPIPRPRPGPQMQGSTFSRAQLTESVVLPNKGAYHPATTTREEIIDYHRASGYFPRPFSFALTAGKGHSPHNSQNSLSPTSPNRGSFLSITSGSGSNRFSVISTSSSSPSVTGGQSRKVYQLFDPVLPDELLLTRAGEKLTIIQSFDDGWCIVGRENPVLKAVNKTPFNSKANDTDGIELGAVPAWCFIKPVKGLRAERPIRSTSLGVTVEISQPGFASREEVMSWSNF